LSFWYGLSFEAAANMPFAAIESYLERLPARQAEMKLLLADVVSVPHMKEHNRRSALNQWMRNAKARAQAVRPATPGVLKLMGIGVNYEQ
jgi:hypothetical protein